MIPVSAELPFENHLDMQGDAAFARVWQAQMPQLDIEIPGEGSNTRTAGRSTGGGPTLSCWVKQPPFGREKVPPVRARFNFR